MMQRLILNGYLIFGVVAWSWVASAQEPVTPGPEHKFLMEQVGTWDAVIKVEGVPNSKGVATYKSELGGLWLVSDFQGDFGGLQFSGKGWDGYDPASKKFVSAWVDSMSTIPLQLTGTYDKTSKTMTMTGEGPGPTGKLQKMKNVSVYKDANHITFTMYVVEGGQENLMMTIEYTRRK